MPTSSGQTRSSSTSRHVFPVSAEDRNFNSSRKTFDGRAGDSSPFADGNDARLEPTFGSDDLANSLVLRVTGRKQDVVVGERETKE